MKSAGQQIQDLVREHLATFDPRVKCVLVAAYQNDERTVLQPLVAERESKQLRSYSITKLLKFGYPMVKTTLPNLTLPYSSINKFAAIDKMPKSEN